MKSTNRTAAVLAVLSLAALAACSKKEAPPAEPAAPAAAPASTTFTAFRLGDLSAAALSDGGIELPNDNQVFGVGLTPADVAAVLEANNLPTDTLKLDVHPLLVTAGDRVMLFDTGAGQLFGPSTGKLLQTMQEAGVDPQKVTDVFISHSHGDHAGGLVTPEGQLAFPNATIRLSRPEWDFLQSQDHYKAWLPVITPKIEAFDPGAELVPGTVTAVEIKGHTPGHSGYRITSGGESLLYVGDSMHHYVVSVQKPEWTIAFDGDNAVGSASRVALINDLAASGQRVYAVHFPFPGVGKLEKRGDTVVWVAE